MKLIESKVFVVLKPTKGRSDVVAVFNERLHADKFVDKITNPLMSTGTFFVEESTLYDFAPDDGEEA